MTHSLFVYGTLQLERVQRLVAGRAFPGRPAVVLGFARRTLRGETYPSLVPAPGAHVDGLVLADVDDAALTLFDAYEGPLYERVRVVAALAEGGSCAAWSWLVSATERHRVGDEPWDLGTFEARDLERFVADYEGFHGR